MINSFWGKFGQQVNLPKTEVVSEPSRLYELLYADDVVVNNANFFNDSIAEVQYATEEEFVAPNPEQT